VQRHSNLFGHIIHSLDRTGTIHSSTSGKSPPHPSLHPVLTSETLFNEPSRKDCLRLIAQLTGLPHNLFIDLYKTALLRFASLVQELPVPDNGPSEATDIFLDCTLKRTARALKLRRGYLLPPTSQPETIVQQQELWTYALFSAALLNGLGSLAIRTRVTLYTDTGKRLKNWSPLEGPIDHKAAWYDFEFLSTEDLEVIRPLDLFFAARIIPTAGLSWLADDRELLAVWLNAVRGELTGAGVLGEILQAAGATFTVQPLLSVPEPSSNVHVVDLDKTNPVTDEQEEVRPVPEVTNPFLLWLNTGLSDGSVAVNHARSLVHVIPEGVILVSPQIFKDYARTSGEPKTWNRIQRDFLRMKPHLPAADGDNFHRIERASGGHISGLLIPEPEKIFTSNIPAPNPSLRLGNG